MYEIYFLRNFSGKIRYSGNKIEVLAAVNMPTYNATNIYVVVNIKVQKVDGSFLYDLAKTQKVFPDSHGVVSMDISSIVDAYLTHFLPPANLDNFVTCSSQIRNFSVELILYNGSTKLNAITDNIRVIKSGTPIEYFLPELGNIADHLLEKWLLISEFTETVHPDDLFWYFFTMPANNNYEFYIEAVLKYVTTSNTIHSLTYRILDHLPHTGSTEVICFPAGYNQNNLAEQLPAGATIVYYQIRVGKTVGSTKQPTALEIINIYVEQRNYYNTKQLVYRSSLGSLMPVRLRATIDSEGTYESQLSNGNQLSYIQNGNIIGGQQQFNTIETWKNNGYTGFISKYEAERLRDFFLSNEKYEVVDGRLVPIIVNTKSVKFYTNNDSLFSIQIEWVHAVKRISFGSSFLPESCPAVLKFFWQQYSSNSIRIFWALPIGYDYFRVIITFPGEDPQTIYLSGNNGAEYIQFIRPASASGSVDLLVQAQVVCDRYNKVPTYGALYSASVAPLDPTRSAIANPDTFTIPIGYSAATVLSPSVLANDIDPAGQSLSCVVVSGDATTAGGLISIDAAGNVTYTPPSPTYTGNDSYVYQMVAGSDAPVDGNITIRVTNNTANIYAATGYGPYVNNGFGEWITNSIYIRFVNSPYSITPYPVTNLTVNYRKTVTIYSSADGYVTPISTTNTDLSSIFNVGQQDVYTGPIPEYTQQVDFSYHKKVVSITILPGTGYSVL